MTERPMTRRERRIERMRTQRIGHAKREAYRTSGTPHMARQAPFQCVRPADMTREVAS